MEIFQTADFTKQLRKFPKDSLRLYMVQEKRFRENLRDPRLHMKKLQGLDGVSSFRVTRLYRVLFYFQSSDAVVFFAIGHRKDVYR